MGAGQSKQQPPLEIKASPPPPQVMQTETKVVSNNDITNNSNTNGSQSATAEGGGGCPMKNADGTYRTMPGFASIFKSRKHPPIDSTKIVEADQPVATTASTTSENDMKDSSKSSSSSGCPVKAESRASKHLTSWQQKRYYSTTTTIRCLLPPSPNGSNQQHAHPKCTNHRSKQSTQSGSTGGVAHGTCQIDHSKGWK